ncbi:MAG: ABC transporter permease [Janthinobacterium lividum]
MSATTIAAPAGAAPLSFRKWGDSILLVVVLVALWELATILLGHTVLAGPWTTLVRLNAIVHNPEFPENLQATLTAFSLGLLISCVGGISLGLALGSRKLASEVMEPLLMALYAIPKITLYPVVLLMCGLGLYAKVMFGVIHGIIPITMFTMNAVLNLKPVYGRTARTCRLKPLEYARHVLLPATVPEVVAGLRIGFSLTLLGTLIGEMFASQSGIGHMLMRAMSRNDIETITALALLLFCVAIVVNLLLLRLHHRLAKTF